MYKNLTKISTKDMTHDEWLEQRRHHVGGSDAAAIVGLNEWSSPVAVWADKLGKTESIAENEAMRQGHDLEEYVAKRFEEQTGKKVRRENNILVNPEIPFAHANVDRLVIGEDAGLECKTTKSLNLKKYRQGEFPDRFYVQCMHYMMVTGAAKWYLAVLVFGSDFFVYEINRDEEEIAALRAAEQEFWGYVESETLPPIDDTNSTKETLVKVFEGGGADEVALDDELTAQIAVRDELKEKIKELTKAVDLIDNQVRAALGNNEVGFAGERKITWKTQTSMSLDKELMKAALPDVDFNEFMKPSVSRVLRYAKAKRKEE